MVGCWQSRFTFQASLSARHIVGRILNFFITSGVVAALELSIGLFLVGSWQGYLYIMVYFQFFYIVLAIYVLRRIMGGSE